MPDAANDAADAALIDALGQTAFTVAAVLTSIGADHDMSLTQVRMLGILRDRRLRMADLATYLGLERSTLSGLVDRAERRGLAERRRREGDGRVVEVALTDAGRTLTESALADVAAALAPLTARLESARRAELAGLLTELLGPSPDSDGPR